MITLPGVAIKAIYPPETTAKKDPKDPETERSEPKDKSQVLVNTRVAKRTVVLFRSRFRG
jgi:hypothetical protein